MAKKFSVIGSAALALFALAGTAKADITVYTSLAAFQAATGTNGTDTFTGLSITSSTPQPMNRSAGSFTYTASVLPTGTSSIGNHSFYGVGSASDPILSTNVQKDTMSFSNFSAGVRSAGGNFFASDSNGSFIADGGVMVTATDASGTITRSILPTSNSNGSFLGFVSTTGVTSFTVVANVASGTWGSVDNLVLAAAPVPEPSTYAMLLAGLAFAGVVVRRRRAA